MTILKHELKEGRISLLIWAAAISFLLGVCILIYPEMEKQMGEISAMFADMGGFSQAFGMDRYWGWAAPFSRRCWGSPLSPRKKRSTRRNSCYPTPFPAPP